MRLHNISDLLVMSSLFAACTIASPIWRIRDIAQQVLSSFPPQREPTPQALYKPSSYLDVRPNAVVLTLTSAGDEVAGYFFLPMKQNVLTRECSSRICLSAASPPADRATLLPDNTPEMPLHPVSAHVVGAVNDEGMVVQSQDLSTIECAIYPTWNRTLNPGKRMEDFAIRISPQDGVVDLTAGQQPAWLGGREVEAYECW